MVSPNWAEIIANTVAHRRYKTKQQGFRIPTKKWNEFCAKTIKAAELVARLNNTHQMIAWAEARFIEFETPYRERCYARRDKARARASSSLGAE
jgi:sulfur relay (sulfurtransferase) DsrC/TusE family protein